MGHLECLLDLVRLLTGKTFNINCHCIDFSTFFIIILIFTYSTQPAYSTGTGSMSSQDMYSRRSPAPFQGDRAPSGYGAGGPSHSAAPGGGGGYGGSNGAYGGSSGGYNGPPSSSGYG